MNDSKKVSRIEWLCAAMIDFIPITILSILALLLLLHQNMCFHNAITVMTVPFAVYMLLKDFFFDGRSIGKRFVNIRIVRPENSGKSCLILRNLPLFLVIFLWMFTNIYKLSSEFRILFVLYMWADFICFSQKGKTIGDCLAHTTLEVSEDPSFLLQKNVSKRIACFVVVLVLFVSEGFSVSPLHLVTTLKDIFITQQNQSLFTYSLHYINILYPCVIYVYILYKMVEHKPLRIMVMALFSGFLCFIYMLKTDNCYIPLGFMLLYVVIIAVLLYMTTDRRLNNSQIRTDFENRLWSGCDLQKVKIYVTIVVMVLIISVLSPIVSFVSESYDGYNSSITLLLSALLPISLVIFPVVYLSEKYINQKSLKWIIYIATLISVVIIQIPYMEYLISQH